MARTPSTASTSAGTVPPPSQTSTATVQAASVDPLTLITRFLSLAGDLDLVVGGESGKLIYMENTGTSTEPEFAPVAEFAVSSYSYLYDDDYVDDDDEVATMPPSNASSYSYLYDDDYIDDGDVVTMPPSSYSNPFDGIYVGKYSAPALGDLDNDGTLRPRPSSDKLRSHVLCLSQVTWTL